MPECMFAYGELAETTITEPKKWKTAADEACEH